MISVTRRLYRALAKAFPYEFKNAYGDELVQVTEEAIEPIWREQGVFGLVRLLLDIIVRIAAEYMAEVRQDIRYGLRGLAATPGFTAVALISLSLSIGVATAAFSQLNGFFLRDVPAVSRPEQLVALSRPASYPDYRRYRELTDMFSATFAYIAPVPFGVSVGARTERTWGHLVTPSYFPALGVRPALGRVFDKDHEQSGHAPTVVLSHRFWQNRLGSDRSVVGQTMRINGHPCTVIGVGPKEFAGASPMVFAADLWMPVSVGEKVAPELIDNALERRNAAMFQVVGRLRPEINMSRAEAELDAVARQQDESYGDANRQQKGRRVVLLPAGKLWPLRERDLTLVTGFFTVMGGLIVLIACANVANMMLARAADRRREIAVRLALGASRARLVRQLLTESMLVATGAGALGLVISTCLMRLSSREIFPYPMPVTSSVEPDGRVLLFTLALIVVTGLALGLAPALQATRPDLTPALKGGVIRLRGYRHLSLGNLLMLSQVAASLTLLLLTAFLALGMGRTLGIEAGFNTKNTYLLSLDPVRDGFSGEMAAAFLEKLLERVKGIPFVTAASLTDTVPMGVNGNRSVRLESSRVMHSARRHIVGTDYFETIGVPIVLGRGFRSEDQKAGAPAVIVSQKLASDVWSGQDPVGRSIRIGDDEVRPFKLFDFNASFDHRQGVSGTFEVVGVAKNVVDSLLLVKAEAPPVIYFPLRRADYSRPSLQGVTLMVRATPGVDVISAVRNEISTMAPNVTSFNARSMPEQIDRMMLPVRVAGLTYSVLGLFGLILASVGLAGVTAHSVAQRGREIGIRMALGAQRRDVLGLVMKQGAALVALGTIVGLACAWAGMRVLSGIMSAVNRTTGTSTADPMLLAGAPLLLAALALGACFVPARKAVQVDPVVMLRQE